VDAAARAHGVPASALRVPGARRVVALALAEAHAVALIAVTPPLNSPCAPVASAPVDAAAQPARRRRHADDGDELQFELGAGSDEEDEVDDECSPSAAPRGVPTLKELCEDALAARTKETARHAIPLLEAADALGAPRLRAHCTAFLLANLDAVLAAPGGAEELCALHGPLLADLEATLLERGVRCSPAHSGAADAARRALRRAGSATALLQRLQRLTFEGDGGAIGGCGAAADSDSEDPEAAERALLLARRRVLRRWQRCASHGGQPCGFAAR
jgi:hypothetical protein